MRAGANPALAVAGHCVHKGESMPSITTDLRRKLEALPKDFWGIVEIKYQDGEPKLFTIHKQEKLSAAGETAPHQGKEAPRGRQGTRRNP